MYVCGISSGLSWLATNVEGSAGGVRMAVAVGTGVSLGMGVAVGCNPASAVSKAWVITILISCVGTGAGWQALSRTERRKKREVRCEKREVEMWSGFTVIFI